MGQSTRTGINAQLDRLVFIGRLKTAAVVTCVMTLLAAALLLRLYFPETQRTLAVYSAIFSLALVSGMIVLVIGACALGLYRGEFKKTILSLFAIEIVSGELSDASFASPSAGDAGGCDAGGGSSDGGDC